MKLRKIVLTIASLSLTSLAAYADQASPVGIQELTSQTQNPVPAQPNNSSFAVTLARQAGVIAGAAQACNQDVSLLSARLDEAITVAAHDPVDRSDAIAAYQQSLKEAFAKQSAERPIPCEVVAMDYKQVPLLRDDYKEVVLSALKAEQTQQAKPAAAPQIAQQPQPLAPATVPTMTPGQPNKSTP
jgi:hypothetical protein